MVCWERYNKNVVGIYSVYLTAAFDLLKKENHIEIMKCKGFPKYIISSVFNYLSTCYGFVQLDDIIYCVREIKAGCIQGSILEPILYNIYTSELENIFSPAKLVAYEDEAYVIATCDSSEKLKDVLKLTISNHFEWLDSLGMVCNLSLTDLIVFGSDKLEVTINDSLIKSSETMKVLGVLFPHEWLKSY